MERGERTVDSRQRKEDSGQWTVDRGQMTVDRGQRREDSGQWTEERGQWAVGSVNLILVYLHM